MKLEQQVCSLEQAKRLKELGVIQKSQFLWQWEENASIHVLTYKGNCYPNCAVFDADYSAWTVAELGQMFPPTDISKNEFICFSKGANGLSWSIDCSLWNTPGFPEDGETDIIEHYTEAECRAKMLIHLLETKTITAEDVNKRLQA